MQIEEAGVKSGRRTPRSASLAPSNKRKEALAKRERSVYNTSKRLDHSRSSKTRCHRHNIYKISGDLGRRCRQIFRTRWYSYNSIGPQAFLQRLSPLPAAEAEANAAAAAEDAPKSFGTVDAARGDSAAVAAAVASTVLCAVVACSCL